MPRLGSNQANGSELAKLLPAPRTPARLCMSPPELPIKARHTALGEKLEGIESDGDLASRDVSLMRET